MELNIKWHIFAGILLSAAGMCFLNYYTLFPEAENEENAKKQQKEQQRQQQQMQRQQQQQR